MCGQDGQSAALQMGADQFGDELDRRRVERHVGFIEDPQRTFLIDQTCQCRPSFLPLRKVAAGQIFASA